MLSKGLVRRARQAARATVAAWRRWRVPRADRRLEPSCVSAIRDEYRSLLPDDEDAALVAEHVETFEELVARAHADGDSTSTRTALGGDWCCTATVTRRP